MYTCIYKTNSVIILVYIYTNIQFIVTKWCKFKSYPQYNLNISRKVVINGLTCFSCLL